MDLSITHYIQFTSRLMHAWMDSNHQHSDLESDALPIGATDAFEISKTHPIFRGEGNSIPCFLCSQDRIRTCIGDIISTSMVSVSPFRHLTNL